MSKEYKKISKFSDEIKQMKAILDLREAKAANKTLKDSKVIPILQEFSSTIYMDYEALVHYRVKHSKNEFC